MKKARLKTENNFAIYETVLHNKCIVCSLKTHNVSVFKHLRRVAGYALLPGNSISHVRQ